MGKVKLMRIGSQRNKIIIESAALSKDNFGAITRTYSTFATWWASISPITGREYVSDGKVNSEVTTRMRGRWISGILPAMRAKFGTRIFSIVAVINIDERNREIELLCKEVI